MNKKIISLILSGCLVLSVPMAFADVPKPNVQSVAIAPMNLSLDKAIELAVKNNNIMKSIEVDMEAAGLSLDRAQYNERKINDGTKALDKGREKLSQLESAKTQLEGVYNNLSALQKSGVSLNDAAKVNPNVKAGLDALSSAGIDPTKSDFGGQYSKTLEVGKLQLNSGQQSFDSAIENANSVIGQKLKLDVDRVLAVNSTTELMTTMASMQNEVTKDGYLIAQKQIALLTRQKYYEVIKCKKIEDLKKLALDRSTKQYTMAKDAFDHGMKAKDDYLLAKTQMDLMKADLRRATMNKKNAEIELKKVTTIDMKTPINIVDDLTIKPIDANLEDGIKQGLEKRIEIRKAGAQYLVDKLNFELTSSQYPDITYQYKEAKIKMNKSKVELDGKDEEVESSIRQSYETLMATKDMLTYIDSVVANAKEALEIAEYRYKEGYGFETSILKSANLEDVAGTIVEVMAAEERLTDVEEKVIEIKSNYNLAKDKYLNDIGTY